MHDTYARITDKRAKIQHFQDVCKFFLKKIKIFYIFTSFLAFLEKNKKKHRHRMWHFVLRVLGA